MVSQVELWDPHQTGCSPLSELNQQRLADHALPLDTVNTHFHSHSGGSRYRQPSSSLGDTRAPSFSVTSPAGTERVVEPPCLKSRLPSDLLQDDPDVSCVSQRHPAGAGSGGFEESEEMKSKKAKANRMGEETGKGADVGQTTKISLRFPLSAGLPVPMAQNHCPIPLSLSPPSSVEGHEMTHGEGTRKMDSLMDKQLPRSPVKHANLPAAPCSSSSSFSSSSSSPIDLTASVRKDSKSTPPFPAADPDSHFQRPPPGPAAGYSGDAFGGNLPHSTNPEHSTTETAHILFKLSTKAFQGQGTRGGEERRMDHKSKSKQVNGDTPRRERPVEPPPPPPSPPSSLSLGPPSPPPAPAAAPALPGDASQEIPKPELLCGVCHRLFSTASSLTVHMRLHRGSRALSCRHCGKAFIHNKRLQSHEAVCKQALPALPIQPKQEPLDEGEQAGAGERGEQGGEGVAVGDAPVEPSEPGHVTTTGHPAKKGRGLLGRHRVPFPREEGLLNEDDHFIKVVDGHIIYFCTVCERSYMTLSSLKRHSNVHSWRRKYPCHYCDKVFALAEYRTKHEVWHTGERRYQCIFCWEAFPTYYNLKTHQKAMHGISPSLISSEKTANGGYKQKVNALKLYRLLPMRSQKRPYKTYSHSMTADGLLLPPDPLSLDCDLPTTIGAGELQALLADAHATGVKLDPDAFPIGLSLGQDELNNLAAAQAGMPVSETERNMSELLGPAAGDGRVPKLPKGDCSPTTAASSLVTYGHTKPSVIVHGTTVSSSVIVHSNQISAGGTQSPLNRSSSTPSPSSSSYPQPGEQPLVKPSHRSSKKQGQKQHRESQKDTDDASESTDISENQKAGTAKAHHKVRKSHGKSDSHSSKPSSHDASSESKGTGPVCQITVRIGEEAIVKRSISETDLMRDKDLSACKAKKGNSDASTAEDQREPRHSHHHRHKHRPHRSSSKEEAEGEPRKKTPKTLTKVREYYFRQEVREEQSDHDGEDNLWRPYYSYKPKRKAPHLQKVKSWQRKLHCKRSLRRMQKGERHTNHTENQAGEDEREEDEDGEGEEEEEEVEEGPGGDGVDTEEQTLKTEEEDSDITNQEGESVVSDRDTPSVPLKENNNTVEEEQHQPTPVNSPVPLADTSKPSTDSRQEPSWLVGGQAAECGTCGRWFSSARKRDKHELTHLMEFVCMLCRASFHSQSRMEEHQRAQHPKPCPKDVAATPVLQTTDSVESMETNASSCDQDDRDAAAAARLARRPFVRNICSQCNKVCKTATALSRHLRRHELSSPAVASEAQPSMPSLSPKLTRSQLPSEPQESSGTHVQPVPVINYTTLTTPREQEKQVLAECVKSSSRSQPCGEAEAESQMLLSPAVPEAVPVDRSPQVQSPRQSIQTPPLGLQCTNMVTSSADGLPNSTADGGSRFLPSPNLHSVLVQNEPECLDYRTPEKKSQDALDQSKLNPVQRPTERPNSLYTVMPARPQITADSSAAAIPLTTEANRLANVESESSLETEKQGKRGLNVLYGNTQEAQDLRVPPLSCSPCDNQAQDLTMPTILARERERERKRERERARERQKEWERERERERAQQTAGLSHFQNEQQHREQEMTLLVPKEEPVSPAPSPKRSVIQTTNTSNTLQHRRSKSPRHSPSSADLARAKQEAAQHSHRLGRQGLGLPTSSVGGGERPSAHALLLPRASEAKRESAPSSAPREPPRVESRGAYPVQDFPLPLIMPAGFRSGKKQQEESLLMSYPAGPLPFASLGKMVSPGDLAKLPFYRDPYPLLCAPQLLAYPYNLATLPMALNMMGASGDKGAETLPFLPALFNYATAAAPYTGMAPHALVGNPSLYGAGSASGKKRDSANP